MLLGIFFITPELHNEIPQLNTIINRDLVFWSSFEILCNHEMV